jgi:predicted HTH domain antitoxin
MPTTVEIKGELELYLRQLIDVGLYNNVAEAVRDSIRHLMKEYDKKEIAVALYKAEKVSLAKAAEIAEVSFTNMKEILVEKGINPRLGAENAEELRQDYLTLKSEVN